MRSGLFRMIMVAGVVIVGCGSTAKSKQSAGEPVSNGDSGGGPAVPADPIAQACHNGIAKSCLSAAGSAASTGRPGEARELYGKGCELGEPLGCLYAGQMWAEVEPVELSRALTLLSKGCELGEPASCYGGGLVAAGLFGGDADMPRAAELHRQGCNANLADSCTSLAEMLLEGAGVEKDEARGEELLEMACNAEEGGACILLGSRADDAAAARQQYERACEFGDGQGCTFVALGLESDASDERQRWFDKGCTADVPDPTSCTFAALPEFKGDAPDKAVAVFRQTCEFGDAMGCFFLAIAKRDGRGAEQDSATARARLDQACESDPEQCERFRKEFEARPIEEK